MITDQQATEYLAAQGVALPTFVVTALVSQANSIEPCLTTHYDADTALLIQLYLLGLMGLGQGDRYLSSQASPSGASQSFRYRDFADRWRGAMSLLRGLDVHGCATGLIPSDPTNTAHAGMWVAKGGCMSGG